MIEKFEGIELKEEHIISELEKIQKLGWKVSVDNNKIYRIFINETKEIIIKKTSNYWIIKALSLGKIISYSSNITNLTLFVFGINTASSKLNINLSIKNEPLAIRISDKTPLDNKVQLLQLINNRKISKIFDPYFDEKSLITLKALYSLGLKFSNDLKCLSQQKEINETIVKDFNVEMKTNLLVKKCKDEHRRFIILDDKTVIIIGLSLNNLNKNEAISIETNRELAKSDITFFNSKWEENN